MPKFKPKAFFFKKNQKVSYSKCMWKERVWNNTALSHRYSSLLYSPLFLKVLVLELRPQPTPQTLKPK